MMKCIEICKNLNKFGEKDVFPSYLHYTWKSAPIKREYFLFKLPSQIYQKFGLLKNCSVCPTLFSKNIIEINRTYIKISSRYKRWCVKNRAQKFVNNSEATSLIIAIIWKKLPNWMQHINLANKLNGYWSLEKCIFRFQLGKFVGYPSNFIENLKTVGDLNSY